MLRYKSYFPLLASIALGLSFMACGGSNLFMRQIPEGGYESTINYRFQAQIYEDRNGKCKRMTIRVRPINKIYWNDAPPDRLQLFDDNCLQPLRFERIQFVSGDGVVRLDGNNVNRFMGDNFSLESELFEWLWAEKVID